MIVAIKGLMPLGALFPKKPQPNAGKRMDHGKNDVASPNNRLAIRWPSGTDTLEARYKTG